MDDALPVLRRLWAGEVGQPRRPRRVVRRRLGLAPAGPGPLRRLARRQRPRRAGALRAPGRRLDPGVLHPGRRRRRQGGDRPGGGGARPRHQPRALRGQPGLRPRGHRPGGAGVVAAGPAGPRATARTDHPGRAGRPARHDRAVPRGRASPSSSCARWRRRTNGGPSSRGWPPRWATCRRDGNGLGAPRQAALAFLADHGAGHHAAPLRRPAQPLGGDRERWCVGGVARSSWRWRRWRTRPTGRTASRRTPRAVTRACGAGRRHRRRGRGARLLLRLVRPRCVLPAARGGRRDGRRAGLPRPLRAVARSRRRPNLVTAVRRPHLRQRGRAGGRVAGRRRRSGRGCAEFCRRTRRWASPGFAAGLEELLEPGAADPIGATAASPTLPRMPDRPLTLMAVHAHPDDEAIGTGGILARYADEGVRTVLVTCTNGELGDAPGGLKPERSRPRRERRRPAAPPRARGELRGARRVPPRAAGLPRLGHGGLAAERRARLASGAPRSRSRRAGWPTSCGPTSRRSS